MIKENQKLLNRLQVIQDAAVIVAAYVLAWYIRFRSGIFALDVWYLSLHDYMRLLIYIVPGYLILYSAFHMACRAGEYHRTDGAYPAALFNKTVGYFPKDVVCVLLCKCISGSSGAECDPYDPAEDTQKRL